MIIYHPQHAIAELRDFSKGVKQFRIGVVRNDSVWLLHDPFDPVQRYLAFPRRNGCVLGELIRKLLCQCYFFTVPCRSVAGKTLLILRFRRCRLCYLSSICLIIASPNWLHFSSLASMPSARMRRSKS